MLQILVFVGAVGVMLVLTFCFGAASLGSWGAGWRYVQTWGRSLGVLACIAGVLYLVITSIVPPL